jgi:exopolysaccharide production protein ExoZ
LDSVEKLITSQSQNPQLPSRTRIQTLDFLRGIAILGVIAIHAVQSFATQYGWLDVLFTQGKYGVQLFFYVSAITMCHMWVLRSSESYPIKKFYIRRVLRIAPMFLLAIPVYLVAHGTAPSYWSPEGIHTRQILMTALFLHGFWPDSLNSVVPGGWSISIEMTFYLLFPFVITWFKDSASKYLYLAIVLYLFNALIFNDVVANLLTKLYVTDSRSIVREFLHFNFINQCPIFLMGCFLYFSMKTESTKKYWFLIAAWLLIACLLKMKFGMGSFAFLLIYLSIGFGVFLAVSLSASFKPFEAIGRRSYSMYLTHFLILDALVLLSPFKVGLSMTLFAWIFSTLLSFYASKLIDNVVEKRFQELANKITASGKQ